MMCFLIDDDVDDRIFFLLALNNFNDSIELVTADSGVHALEKINARPNGNSVSPGDKSFLPDYIFLDLNMPYMSGRECLTKLREVERLKNVPIILYSTVKDFEELASLGATGFITKQNSVADLSQVLSGIIK